MKDKVRGSLRNSFIDGVYFSIMYGFGDAYFSAYAILLKATTFQVGLLSSLPGFISSIFQLWTPELTEKVGRHRIMSIGVFMQVLLWAPVIAVPFIFPEDPAPWLIGAVTLYLLASSFAGPAWTSIMSQYLPPEKRGHYFSWRQRIHGFITVGATFAAGLVLIIFPKHSVTGFTIIFTVAMVMRFFSWYYLNKMFEPRLVPKAGACFTFYDFIRRARESNFVKFVLFSGAINFAVSLSSPYFSVYMLRELRFDYLSYITISTLSTVATLLSLPAWGKHTDKVGSMQVIRVTSLLLPALPVLWLFSPSKVYLGFVQIVTGFVWSGFNLAVANFIFDAVSEEKRVRCVAYFNLINGVGIFLGAVIGGIMVPHLPVIKGSHFLTAFAISGIMRLLIRSFFMPRMREVKPVTEVTNAALLSSVVGLRTLTNITEEAPLR